MKPANLVLTITMVSCLTLVVTAQRPQQEQPQPSQPQMNQDRLEAAHGQLYSSQDKAKEASRLTQAVAPALPGTGSSYAPIARKNFVDEFIFGKMERDNIPHAPLAGDAEFLRRAYLDATGLLPAPDEVEYGYGCIRLLFHEPKTAVVIDIDEPDEDDNVEPEEGSLDADLN